MLQAPARVTATDPTRPQTFVCVAQRSAQAKSHRSDRDWQREMFGLVFGRWEGRLPAPGSSGRWGLEGMSRSRTPAGSAACVRAVPGNGLQGEGLERKRDGAQQGPAVLSLRSQSQAEL